MLVGMPTHYHVSCRVRSSEQGIDATPTEHADTVIETSGTAFAALTRWLITDGSWLHCSPKAVRSLLDLMNQDAGGNRSELEIMGWDSRENGGDKYEDGYYNDWETNSVEIDETNHTLEMCGTACCSEFEFEVKVTPHDPSEVSSVETGEHPPEYTNARYLMALSERVFLIAPIHGVDQGDYDQLRAIAAELSEQAVQDHLNEHTDD